MKHNKSLFLSISILMSVYIPLSGSCGPQSPGERAWIIADEVLGLTSIIESKLELLISSTSEATCIATSTMLLALESTVDSLLLTAEGIDSSLDVVYSDIQALISQIGIIITEVSVVDQQLNGIQVNDFGGTWTALEMLEQSLSISLESVIDSLVSVESKVDRLIIENASFSDITLLTLQEISVEALTTMTMMQSLSESVSIFLVNVPSAIDVAEKSIFTLDSNVSVLQQNVQNCFASTMTTLNSMLLTVETINVQTQSVESVIAAINFTYSFTTLQQELVAIDSVADAIISVLDRVDVTLNKLTQ